MSQVYIAISWNRIIWLCTTCTCHMFLFSSLLFVFSFDIGHARTCNQAPNSAPHGDASFQFNFFDRNSAVNLNKRIKQREREILMATYNIWRDFSIAKSSRRNSPVKVLAVREEVALDQSGEVVVVSSVDNRIPKDDDSRNCFVRR